MKLLIGIGILLAAFSVQARAQSTQTPEGLRQYAPVLPAVRANFFNLDPKTGYAVKNVGGGVYVISDNMWQSAALLPEDAELVKAFGSLGAESLGSGAKRLPEPAVLFYATDYPDAANAVARLIAASGFSPVSVGGIDQAIRIEVGGDLHQFGKLGRLVSAKEAESLV